MKRLAILALLALGLAACSPSPEASRTRGGGSGADVGNHTSTLLIHAGGSEAYYGTPNLNPRVASSSSAKK